MWPVRVASLSHLDMLRKTLASYTDHRTKAVAREARARSTFVEPGREGVKVLYWLAAQRKCHRLERAHIASREGGALLLTPHPPPSMW